MYSEENVNRGDLGLTALFGLARGRKYSNLVHLEHCVSTEEDEFIFSTD